MTHALLAQHSDDMPVAFGNGTRSARDLLRDAGCVAAALPEPRADSQVLLVLRQDRYTVACAILGAMARGHVVALPPETGRESITRIADDPRTVVIAHDTPSSIGIRLPELLASHHEAAPLTREELARAVLQARIFVREHTGAITAIEKPAGAWLREAAAGVAFLGLRPGARVASTVAPAQPYGIVLSVLAPLLVGAAFWRDFAPAQLLAEALPRLRCSTLVSVPAHLRVLAEAPRAVSVGIARVVSSLAVLPLTLARAFEAQHGLAITDAFSSARSGLIAARESPAQNAFQPLSGVALDVLPAILATRSDAREPWVRLACHVRACAGGFDFLGEAEDALPAKAGADAPSLFGSTLEAFAQHLPHVTDAAVIPMHGGSAPTRLFVAVASDRAELMEVAGALLTAFGEIARPTRMLRVGSIKRDSTGRYARSDILRLFRLRPDGSALNFRLPVGAAEPVDPTQPMRRVFQLHIPLDYAYFDGHFTGYPILAGAVQLSELVLPCVRAVRPELHTIRQVSRLKFTGRIQPGEHIAVELQLRAQEPLVDFSLKRGNTLCAAGTLQFAIGAPA